MRRRGLLVGCVRGGDTPERMLDADRPGRQRLHLYDATNPQARAFLWSRLSAGYLRNGIRAFWLDADEPETNPLEPDNLVFHAGPGSAWHNLYPHEHARGVYEGLTSAGERRPLTLNRSAWAGSQRYGAAVWSGDIECTFDALRRQLAAGLNMGLSGIPWWTTDIGGFKGGDPADPGFRELLVRWFQFATYCPILRMHGYRATPGQDRPLEEVTGAADTGKDDAWTFRDLDGGPNEPWSFGQEAYDILARHIRIRSALKPYLADLARQAAESGAPVMRPLFWDFGKDPASWAIADQFMLGPDLLAAPVLEEGALRRRVHLPAGTSWICAWTGEERDGGTARTVPAPVGWIPVFLRLGSTLAEERAAIFGGG